MTILNNRDASCPTERAYWIRLKNYLSYEQFSFYKSVTYLISFKTVYKRAKVRLKQITYIFNKTCVSIFLVLAVSGNLKISCKDIWQWLVYKCYMAIMKKTILSIIESIRTYFISLVLKFMYSMYSYIVTTVHTK